VDSFVGFECNCMHVCLRVCVHVCERVCVFLCSCVCVCARAVLIIGGFVDRPTRPGVSLEVREKERETVELYAYTNIYIKLIYCSIGSAFTCGKGLASAPPSDCRQVLN
jgi:hypothetical protein